MDNAPSGFITATSWWLAEVTGLAVGYWLTGEIVGAGNFIPCNFEPDDWLYLFSFRSGVYTARKFSSQLRMYGLAPPG